jgi:hypothetical protein
MILRREASGMRFKGPHKFAPLLSTADVSLVRPALMFRGPRTEDSVRMVGTPECMVRRVAASEM